MRRFSYLAFTLSRRNDQGFFHLLRRHRLRNQLLLSHIVCIFSRVVVLCSRHPDATDGASANPSPSSREEVLLHVRCRLAIVFNSLLVLAQLLLQLVQLVDEEQVLLFLLRQVRHEVPHVILEIRQIQVLVQ